MRIHDVHLDEAQAQHCLITALPFGRSFNCKRRYSLPRIQIW